MTSLDPDRPLWSRPAGRLEPVLLPPSLWPECGLFLLSPAGHIAALSRLAAGAGVNGVKLISR